MPWRHPILTTVDDKTSRLAYRWMRGSGRGPISARKQLVIDELTRILGEFVENNLDLANRFCYYNKINKIPHSDVSQTELQIYIQANSFAFLPSHRLLSTLTTTSEP